MASLIIVCVLIAGCSVAVVFSGIFFGKLIIDYYKQPKEQKEETVKQVVAEEKQKDEVEEIDLDEMLAALEARAKEAEEVDNGNKAPVSEELTKVEEPVEEPAKKEDTELQVASEKESELDYEARLAKAKEAFEKLEKDYQKNKKSLNKYSRTERKKEKNEKLLNKKAAELASLNLSVYNVKELADVDPEKKAKQEELTTHVAELKAAIVEAEEYLEANREKHNQELKLNKYLEKEHARYEEEIKSLEEFLNKKD